MTAHSPTESYVARKVVSRALALDALFWLALLLAFFCISGQALASSKSGHANKKPTTATKASKHTTYRPSPSEESRRERERRLERECRDKPNAGACAGFGYGTHR